MADSTRDMYHINIDLAIGGGMSRREAEEFRVECVEALIKLIKRKKPERYHSFISHIAANSHYRWDPKQKDES